MSEAQKPARVTRAYLILFLTVPLALLISFFPVAATSLARCGFNQCRDDPGGWASPYVPEAFSSAGIAAALVAAAIFLVPWLRPWWLRLAVAAAGGVVAGGASITIILF